MSDQPSNLSSSWIGSCPDLGVIDGVEYDSVELQHLASCWMGRHAVKYQGRDDGTTELEVLAYVIRERDGRQELLVLEQRENPEAGALVPTGSIRPGETPAAAVQRVMAERTGVRANPIRRLDVYEWERPTNGRWHRRHVYEFTAPDDLSKRWEHVVSAGCDGEKPQAFICAWLSPAEAYSRLADDHGRSARRLCKAS